jgi:cobalt-zinc-cadmium efflux system outer membrane protein
MSPKRSCRRVGVGMLFIICVCVVRALQAQQVLGPSVMIPGALTLADAERLLIERNVAIAATRFQLNAAQASRLIAGYKPNPTIQFGAEQFPFTSNQQTVPRFVATDSNAGAQPTYTVQFSKIIERGEKRELRVAQADATVEAAEFLIRDTIRQQLFQLRQAFGTAILARENARLARQIDEQYQRSEQLTVIKTQAGDLPPLELYRVRAGRLAYQQAVIDAGNAYQQATRDILNLLDGGPADVTVAPIAAAPVPPANAIANPLTIVGDFTDRPLTTSLDDLTKQSLEQRPDVRLARRNLTAAERGVDLAKAQRARDVVATVEYQRVGNDQALGFITQVPLFLYNNQRAGVAQADAQRKAAEAVLRQTERQATTDVAKAYAAYLTASQSMTLYSTDNLIHVRRVQDITQFSFEQGSMSLFELLEVQRSSQQAFMAFNQARANYQVSLWQLEQAVGAPVF